VWAGHRLRFAETVCASGEPGRLSALQLQVVQPSISSNRTRNHFMMKIKDSKAATSLGTGKELVFPKLRVIGAVTSPTSPLPPRTFRFRWLGHREHPKAIARLNAGTVTSDACGDITPATFVVVPLLQERIRTGMPRYTQSRARSDRLLLNNKDFSDLPPQSTRYHLRLPIPISARRSTSWDPGIHGFDGW